MSKSGNTLAALVAGAALGAVAGILYAPESGDKTRKKIKKEAKKAKLNIEKKAKETYATASVKAAELKGTVEERIDTALTSASYKADDAIVALERKLEQLRAQNAKLQKPVVNGNKTATATTTNI